MPDASATAEQPLYTIGITKSGFLGAFARVPIKKGTVVLCEQPLFVVDAPLQAYLFQRAAGGNGPTPVEGDEEDETEAATLEEFLDRGIRRTLRLKTEEQRKEFWDLANTHDELPPAFGIFTTNAVSTVEETGGLFLTLSRFNSACRPNLTRPLYDSKARTFSLSALLDIPEGDELTWPYLGIPFDFDGIDYRREELSRVFGFDCCCAACGVWQSSSEKKAESNARLLKLRRLKECLLITSGGRQRTMERISALAEEEGLHEVASRLKAQAEIEPSAQE
ncbi:hypothetical protein BCR35DRAFT_304909 [Leucosporidium creatinivorum]|uniref:SET domain-containing protein n=1 Tax=Leucosporidium creatinivorum TaxID=106004 RepID=A0A1Y2F5E9_9BASI|nr:hypothetical protein BCR35DRAFT_304909 [Leucosporidium creatinivorum]